MATKKISKASKRRLVIFGTISVFVIGYFCVSLVTYGYRLNYLKKEQTKLSANLTDLQSKEENLKIEIQKLKDPDYVARYARETYLYTKDGEYVIKLEPATEKIEETKKEVVDYKYIVIGVGIVLFLIVLYIVRKGKRPKKEKRMS